MAQNMSNVKVDLDAPAWTANFNSADGTGGGVLYEKDTLIDATIPQSMVIDYVGKPDTPAWIYIIQCADGGTDEKGSREGDLVINRCYRNGARYDTMRLVHYHDPAGGTYVEDGYTYESGSIGFGHGTQIGIEFAPDGDYLWIDFRAKVIDRETSAKETEVTGNSICRFKYQAGTFNPTSLIFQEFDVDKYLPADQAPFNTFTCTFDNVNKRLAVKYANNIGQERISIFDVSYQPYYSTRSHINYMTFTKAKEVPNIIPTWWKAKSDGTPNSAAPINHIPNGWHIFGDIIYLMYGTATWHPSSETATEGGQSSYFSPEVAGNYLLPDGTYHKTIGNVKLIRYNWKTGAVEQETTTQIWGSLKHREPEGLCMVPYFDASGNVIKLRLYFQFAGGVTGARNWNLAYKESVITPTQL